MCGRYSIIPGKAKGKSKVVELLKKYEAEARYNAAPSQQLPVITNDAPDELQFFSWGLLPHWSKERNYKHKPINARAETLLEKPVFRELVNRRRCLVPADGFYEWRGSGKNKTPFRILLRNEDLFTFAGLWDEWADRDSGEIVHSFTIITTEANELVKPLHERMPVLLHPAEEESWLTDAGDTDAHLQLLRPYPSEEMKLYQVSGLVNSVANNIPQVLQPEIGGLFG